MNKEKMLSEAFAAMEYAYAPYSHFHVGACVETRDGKFFRGINIENASYPVTVCGERVAIFNAYANGYRKDDIVGIAIVTSGNALSASCGMCRQAMIELLKKDTPVIFSNGQEEMIMTVDEMLPHSFSGDDLL